MRTTLSLTSILALASSAVAKTITIAVGNGGLVFTPNVTTADVNDILDFHFYPRLHNVVQGDPTKACQPIAGGFYSGFQAVSAGVGSTFFQVTVKDKNPIYIYCSQVNPLLHCAGGMVGVINAGTSDLSAYATLAKTATNATIVTPASLPGTGGVLVNNSNITSVTGTGSSPTTTPASTGAGSVTGSPSGTTTSTSVSKAAGAIATAARWGDVLGLGALVGGAAVFML